MLKINATSKIFLGVVFLVIGCVIYLLFRTKTLYIYQWCAALGLSNVVDHIRFCVHGLNTPDFIKFNLPDGLYCAAYILIMDAIWQNDNSSIKHFIITLLPVVTIASEVLQYYGLVNGTFDVLDLTCYFVPLLIYTAIIIKQPNTFNLSKKEKE